jgi:hypothetical protein
MDSPEPPDRLSPAEVDAQLRAFTGADWARLRSLSRLAAAGLPGWTSEDLLIEALTKLYEGDRVWQRGVHSLVTLKVLMGSIASNERKKVKKSPIDLNVVVDAEESEEPGDGHLPTVTASELHTPEHAADSRSQYEYLEKLVADDEDCGMLVMLWAEGLRGKEAAAELDWDVKRYDATRKRLEKRLQPLKALRKMA